MNFNTYNPLTLDKIPSFVNKINLDFIGYLSSTPKIDYTKCFTIRKFYYGSRKKLNEKESTKEPYYWITTEIEGKTTTLQILTEAGLINFLQSQIYYI